MKVTKEASKNGGYHIIVEVGGKVWDSYWSAPGESVDHAGLQYLTDRYSIITTEKRAEEFKRQYKNLWIEITPGQLELMRHALGLQYQDKPYRNRYSTIENNKDWNILVSKGLAIKGIVEHNSLIWFWCSKQGVEFVTGKKISDEDYEEL